MGGYDALNCFTASPDDLNNGSGRGDKHEMILAERLTRDCGSGLSHSGLTRMAKFYDCLPEEPIVATLSLQLSWSHFVELITVEDGVKRDFTDLCAQSRWSLRTLRARIAGMPLRAGFSGLAAWLHQGSLQWNSSADLRRVTTQRRESLTGKQVPAQPVRRQQRQQ